MRVTVNRSRCEGHGMCISVAPDLFELDEDGYSRPLRDPVPGDVHERAREAGAACPVAAITVEEGA